MKKRIRNKSSIVRLIISNYSRNSISEIKVIHEKRSFLDSIDVVDMSFLDNNVIHFKEVRVKSMDALDKTSFNVTYNQDGSFTVSTERDENNRVYEITGKYFKKIDSIRYRINPKSYTPDQSNATTVKLTLKMIEHPAENIERYTNRRRPVTQTERKLLGDKQTLAYSKICLEETESITSKKIYQINRFLEYRSDFLVYFQLINNLLIPANGPKEIWRLSKIETNKYESFIKDISVKLHSTLIQTITDKNSLIDAHNQKLSSGRKKIEYYQQLSLDKIESDVKKIISIYSNLRHSLMHYDYKFFDDLFTSKPLEINNVNLNELLDLNLFAVLESVKEIKEANKSSYIEKGDKIRIFDKNKEAKTIHELFWMICERKNGFNKLVNDFFINDGLEDKYFKELINQDFKNRIDFLEKAVQLGVVNGVKLSKKTKKDMNEDLLKYKAHLSIIGEAYIDDIQYSREYKSIYNDHQNLCQEVNQLIYSPDPDARKKIADLNKEINKNKKSMKEITKRNALIRLEYKMRIAFSILAKDYDLNIDDFKQRFSTNQNDQILANKSDYLNYKLDEKAKFNLGKMKNSLNVGSVIPGIVEVNDKNNLFKFSLLTYLLLPKEVRGSFLGTLKKYYFDIKNSNYGQNEFFYHNLRLFEKNIKKFEIFNYDLSSDPSLTGCLEKLQSDFDLSLVDDQIIKKRVNSSLVITVLKFYKNIFSYINEFEVNLLIDKSMSENKTINEVLGECTKNEYYNFSELIHGCNLTHTEFSSTIDIRNMISHLEYSSLFSLEKTVGFRKKEFCGMSHVVDKLTNEVSSTMCKFGYLNKFSDNNFKMKNEHMATFLDKDLYDDILENQDIDNKKFEFFKKYSKNSVDELGEFILQSKKSLEDFKENPTLPLIANFNHLQIPIQNGRKITSKKISDVDLLVHKQAIFSTVNNELAKIESLYIELKIKDFKEKFSKQVLQ